MDFNEEKSTTAKPKKLRLMRKSAPKVQTAGEVSSGAPESEEVDIATDPKVGIWYIILSYLGLIGLNIYFNEKGDPIRVDDWWSYLIEAAVLFITFMTIGGIAAWEEKNGKTKLAERVNLVSLILGMVLLIIMVRDLWKWLF